MNSRTRKSLLQSYYRQRNIASEQSYSYDILPYEVNEFVITNKLINIDKIDSGNIFKIVTKKPKLVEYLKNGLNGYYISQILYNQPELIDSFKDRLDELSENQIKFIIIYQPQLINYFKNRLGELNSDQIMAIISKHPQLKPYFENE